MSQENSAELNDRGFSVGYNDRLFKGGIRGWLHNSRFLWVTNIVAKHSLNTDVVCELGCFDARILSFCGDKFGKYYGYDAGWEGGLDSAKATYKSDKTKIFGECLTPEQMKVPEGSVDLFLSLETLEHIPRDILPGYFQKMEKIMKDGGTLLISVPNEKGPFFAVKEIIRILVFGAKRKYSVKEYFWASTGQLHKLERNEHKGFDWKVLRYELAQYFEVQQTYGLQLPFLPKWCNASIGFRLKKRPTQT